MSPKSLAPIPSGSSIVPGVEGITDFFRLRWQQLIDGFKSSPTVASIAPGGSVNAAVVTATAFVTLAAGLYRVSYYMRKVVADGVSSSLTMTIGWSEGGIAQTKSAPALALDSVLAEQDNTFLVRADASTNITYAIAYASNTPGTMTYLYNVAVEQLV